MEEDEVAGNVAADQQAYRLRVMKIFDVLLRVPILYFLDGLFSGLWLCCYANLIGFTPNLNISAPSYPAANFSTNSFLETVAPSSNSNGSVRVGLEFGPDFVNQAAFLQVPTFYDALFSWNCECEKLWMYMTWATYLSLGIVYYSCFFTATCLFLANSNQLLACIDWIGPLILAASSLIWSWLDVSDLLESKKAERQRTALSIFFLTSIVTKIMLRFAHGLIASRLYIRSRKDSYFYAQRIFDQPREVMLKLPFFAPLIMIFGELLPILGGVFVARPVAFVGSLYSFVILLEIAIAAFHVAPAVMKSLRKSVLDARDMMKNFGIQFLVITHWSRLNVPIVMRVFWLSRLSIFLVYAMISFDLFSIKTPTLYYQKVWSGCEYLLVRSCETGVALLGMTSAISTIGHYFGALFQTILVSYGSGNTAPGAEQAQGAIDDEEHNAGSLTGILFIILAIQTGLTELTPQKRLGKLYRNFWLLSMAMMHFVHHMVNSVLLRLSTTGRYRWSAHARAWLISTILYVAPLTFIWLVWSRNELWNPWLISVALFALEVIIKTSVTMKVYILFMLDTKLKGGLRNLDDLVYFVRGSGAVLEFLFAILLLLNGVWILLFEQSGVVRSFMICVHAYCNIWLQAKEGWASFKRRWHAAKKLDLLETASLATLAELNQEVCSICYQELGESLLNNVKITKCRHYFHAACLKKWLYVQDRCPMCHASVISGKHQRNNVNQGQENGGEQENGQE